MILTNQEKEIVKISRHMYTAHLTPKQHTKLVKLVGEKCNVKCKLNDVELSVLWDTGAQISLLSTTQLKKYFGDMKIQNINLLLNDATNFD